MSNQAEITLEGKRLNVRIRPADYYRFWPDFHQAFAGCPRKWDGRKRLMASRHLLRLLMLLDEHGIEATVDKRLYMWSKCLVNKRHGASWGWYRKCPKCDGETEIRAGVIGANKTPCIARCYEAKGNDCDCVCLAKCHGEGACVGDHKLSDWGKTIHNPRLITRPRGRE